MQGNVCHSFFMSKDEGIFLLFNKYPELTRLFETNSQVQAALMAYKTRDDVTLCDAFCQLTIRLCNIIDKYNMDKGETLCLLNSKES